MVGPEGKVGSEECSLIKTPDWYDHNPVIQPFHGDLSPTLINGGTFSELTQVGEMGYRSSKIRVYIPNNHWVLEKTERVGTGSHILN